MRLRDSHHTEPNRPLLRSLQVKDVKPNPLERAMFSKVIAVTAAAALSVMFVAGSTQAQPAGRLLVNQLSGKCLDVPGISNQTPGTPLQLFDCETNGVDYSGKPSDQFWVYGLQGQIRNTLSGMCIDISGTDNGSLIQVEACDATNPAQNWIVRQDGFIQNQATGKCINVSGVAQTANQTPLALTDCEIGLAQTNQRWRS